MEPLGRISFGFAIGGWQRRTTYLTPRAQHRWLLGVAVLGLGFRGLGFWALGALNPKP